MSFFFGLRKNAAKSVLCGVVRNTRADVETFDIVNLIFPWGAPPPYVFPPISVAVSEDSGLPNRSPMVVLKYTDRAGNPSFSLPLLVPFISLYLSFWTFLWTNSKSIHLYGKFDRSPSLGTTF